MRKILFLDEKTKKDLQLNIDDHFKIKNRLIRMLFENDDHILSNKNLNNLHNKYQEQIVILDLINSILMSGKSRQQVQEVNRLINEFNNIEIETGIKKIT